MKLFHLIPCLLALSLANYSETRHVKGNTTHVQSQMGGPPEDEPPPLALDYAEKLWVGRTDGLYLNVQKRLVDGMWVISDVLRPYRHQFDFEPRQGDRRIAIPKRIQLYCGDLGERGSIDEPSHIDCCSALPSDALEKDYIHPPTRPWDKKAVTLEAWFKGRPAPPSTTYKGKYLVDLLELIWPMPRKEGAWNNLYEFWVYIHSLSSHLLSLIQ